MNDKLFIWILSLLMLFLVGYIAYDEFSELKTEKDLAINQSLQEGFVQGYQQGIQDAGTQIINSVGNCVPYVIRTNDRTYTINEVACP